MQLIRKLIIPFKVDSLLLNLLVKIPQVVIGLLLAFHLGNHSFGVPWSPEESKLALFEVAPWFLDVVSNFYPPIGNHPYSFGVFSGVTKIIGGIALIIGFLSRIASFCVMLLMTVFLINQDFIDFNLTFPLFFIAVSCFSLYFGSSKFSVDHFIATKFFG